MNAPPKSNLILMAEDDSDDQLLVRDAFAETGFDVDLKFVPNGVELMDYLRQKNGYSRHVDAPRPGLIILDLNMPRKDGREALREIKADAQLRRIPVVILTSFISKPASFDILVNTMRAIGQYWFNFVVLPATS
jgi:CheY-like chemotaxis protein